MNRIHRPASLIRAAEYLREHLDKHHGSWSCGVAAGIRDQALFVHPRDSDEARAAAARWLEAGLPHFCGYPVVLVTPRVGQSAEDL